MWIPGEGVLYAWVECIRSSEFLDLLGLASFQNGEKLIRQVGLYYVEHFGGSNELTD